ncbi:MAG: serine recombinase [Mycobacterium sp.]|nr:MAG: serine recombinase [Mycobacterium sp.]
MTVTPTQDRLVRAACYCRISSDPNDKREGTQRQREDTAALCEVKEWTVAGYYVDDDRSASNGKKRPEWERLLADIKAGKIDAIAAWDQDRGWRMMHELEELRRFFTSLGREVKLATTGQGEIDLYSPTGVLAAQIKTAVSEHEVAMMRVRMRRAAVQKAERGLPKWRRAFGYLPDTRSKEDDDGTRQVDPAVKPLVEQAYAAVLAGNSLADVCRMWNDAGALTQRWARPIDPETGTRRKDGRPVLERRPWTQPQVSNFLRKPRNAGLRDHNGEIVHDKDGNPVKGTWPPLVDVKTWQSAQAVLNGPGRAPGKKTVRRHLLTGVLRCGKPGCGGYLSGGTIRESGPVTYSCKRCRGISVRAADVEPLVLRLVSDRLAMPDAVDLLKAEIHDAAEAERIRTELAALYEDRRQIGIERAKRLLTGEQAQVATAYLNDQIAVLERAQQDDERLRVFADLPLGTPEVAAAVERLSADRFRAVLAVLAETTVLPVGKGHKVFSPDRVQWAWKGQ